MLVKIAVDLVPIVETLGMHWEYSLDEMPVNLRAS